MTAPARPYAWERSYPAGVRWDAPIEVTTLPALLDDAVARFADRPALDYRERRISYRELGDFVDRTAAGLIDLGVGRGSTVALYYPNTPWHPIATFAAARCGARIAQLSPLDAERELIHKLADSGARILFTTRMAGLLPMAQKLLAAGHIDRLIVGDDAEWGPSPLPPEPFAQTDTCLSFTSLMRRGQKPDTWPQVGVDDVALLQYTGGTTGPPKGAMLTHANLTAAVATVEEWVRGQDLTGSDERVICVLPLFHIYAFSVVMLRSLAAGFELLLRPRFDVETLIRDIEVKRATVFPGVPTMWIALAAHPGIDKRDLSSLRFCGSGGAPLPVEVAQRFERLIGQRLGNGYGMTETSAPATGMPRAGAQKAGSIGIPLPGIAVEVVALDDSRRVLGADEIGEFRIRGRNVMAGYWNRPEETRAAFVDGFLLTGDLGYMDEDGYFFLVDRKKDLIISGGFNVYPHTIEEAIFEHPDVEEAIVIGVPDEYRGEAAKAFVKLRAGAPPLTLEALREFLADKIGRHEMPAALDVRDTLPRTAVGKLSKKELVEEERQRRNVQSAPRRETKRTADVS
jgi:long-chain acyl-CoA synthetase